MFAASEPTQTPSRGQPDDAGIAAFLGLARSANVFFDLVNDHLTVRAVNPNWAMWSPIRHCLSEIGQRRIEDYFRRVSGR